MNLRSVLRRIGIRLSAPLWQIDEALDDDVAHTMNQRQRTVESLTERTTRAERANHALSSVIKQAKHTYTAVLHGEEPIPHLKRMGERF